MIRGVMLDFYGTVVDEDDEVIDTITRRIAAEEPERNPTEITALWGGRLPKQQLRPLMKASARSETLQSVLSRTYWPPSDPT